MSFQLCQPLMSFSATKRSWGGYMNRIDKNEAVQTCGKHHHQIINWKGKRYVTDNHFQKNMFYGILYLKICHSVLD